MAKSTAATRRRSQTRNSTFSGSDIYLGHYTHKEALPIRSGYEALVRRAIAREQITIEDIKTIGFPHRRAVAVYDELRACQARSSGGTPVMPELAEWQRKEAK
jgi:hypothetical protein